MDLLRFFTAGSVDDGKSTLIGRLLHDSGSLFEDQLAYLENERQDDGHVDFSRLTDGLKDEIEQGITIDVAYRYFSTSKRKFIIADSPGHFQYTRNMMTAASTAGLGVFVVDAEHGVTDQTRRHLYISSLMMVPRAVICINKIDKVGYSKERFEEIVADIEAFKKKLFFQKIICIPTSALKGDMVVERKNNMNWYEGPALLELLETIVTVSNECKLNSVRFIVQNILKSNEKDLVRLYAGRMLSGTLKKGDEIFVYPAGIKTKVKDIYLADKKINETTCPFSVSLSVEDDVDISRGSLITNVDAPVRQSDFIEAYLCSSSDQSIKEGMVFTLKMLSRVFRCKVENVLTKIDVKNLTEVDQNGNGSSDDGGIHHNEMARIKLKTSRPLYFDRYRDNRENGSFILIDQINNNVRGAGVILKATS